MKTARTIYMHWRNGRESRACDGSTANPAHATRDTSKVTCPKCKAKIAAMKTVPAAACPKCGGWTSFGGMSQHANTKVAVDGRVGCTCHEKS